MITTNVSGGGHFYVTTQDPAGDWSEPVWIEGDGFDPDLFWDDDGTVYFMEHDLYGNGITQWKINLETGALLGAGKQVWAGFEDRYCEAPHLYKINGMYYLLVAEGGTYRGHMAVVARSQSAEGPFESCPYNPILTHRHHVTHDIQSLGHADLVQTHDGQWWAVFLGTRPLDQRYHHLGRETFLAPVRWTADGWPIILAKHETLSMAVDRDPLPTVTATETLNHRDDFASDSLNMIWNFRRNPIPGTISLTQRKGWLSLLGAASKLSDPAPVTYVGRRQSHFNIRLSALMEFSPRRIGEEAGLAVVMDEKHHVAISLRRQQEGLEFVFRRVIGELTYETRQPCTNQIEIVEWWIEADLLNYRFGYKTASHEVRTLGVAETKYVSAEVADTFTGVYIGMFATGNGERSQTTAYFDWFEYRPISS
jgi:alpha-N-arabinofuranosidase